MSDIDTGIILVYFAAMVLIGVYASRQQDDIADYFTAGGRMGAISIACLWLASWTGAASIIGGAANAYDYGISSGWYIGSMAVGCLLFGLLLAGRVKKMGEAQRFLTYPDLIESVYDSRTRIIATISTIVAYIAFAAAQIVAAAFILQTLFDVNYEAAVLVSSAVIVAYTAFGGYLAVTYTDWVQVAIFFIGVVIIGIPVAVASGGNWSTVTTTLPASYFDIGAYGWPKIAAMAISIPLSFFTAMDSYTRCFSAKSPEVARRGALLAAALLVPLMIGAIWLGLTSRVLFPDAAADSDVLSLFVTEQFPIGLKGIMIAGLLSALMSTADISILVASANATRDIYQRFVNPDVEPRRLFHLSVVASALVGLAAALMAWKMRDIIDIILVAFTINSAALFVPTMAMFYMKNPGRRAAFWSMLCSLLVVLAWYAGSEVELAAIFRLDPLWPGLAVSIGLFAVINAVERRRS